MMYHEAVITGIPPLNKFQLTATSQLWLAAVMEVRTPICILNIDKALLRRRILLGLRQRTRQPLSSNNAWQKSQPSQP